jgi:hypothetical protein
MLFVNSIIAVPLLIRAKILSLSNVPLIREFSLSPSINAQRARERDHFISMFSAGISADGV